MRLYRLGFPVYEFSTFWMLQTCATKHDVLDAQGIVDVGFGHPLGSPRRNR